MIDEKTIAAVKSILVSEEYRFARTNKIATAGWHRVFDWADDMQRQHKILVTVPRNRLNGKNLWLHVTNKDLFLFEKIPSRAEKLKTIKNK